MQSFNAKFPDVTTVMLGRGLIANPGLAEAITTGKTLDKNTLKAFHDRLFKEYTAILSGERNVLFKMKEAWFYMSHMFSNYEKYGKKIKKSQYFRDYHEAVSILFEEQEILDGAGLFSPKINE